MQLQATTELPVTALILLRKINFDKSCWGKDADEFLPERFLRTDSKLKQKIASFAHGPRACIGKNLAKISMKMELIYLFRNFRLDCSEDLKNREMSSKVITQFKQEPLISINYLGHY